MSARQRQRATALWAPQQTDPIDREPWMDLALCAEVDGELFFPEKGAPTKPAKSICRRCEVESECLDYALREGLDWGVWGGMSAQERKELKRKAAA